MAQEHTNQDAERELRAAFYEDIKAGKLSIAGAVATMRRISRLTPGDFARHRGIDVDTLEQIELAEALSAHICEVCGHPGRVLVHGSAMTRCLDHAPAGSIMQEDFLAQGKVPGIAP